MNKWWLDQDNERYWLESTDRKDIGADLYAPIYDDSGKENWRYTLLRALNIGDVVFHYYKPHQAIISRSVVASLATETPVVWGAKGESARNRGTKPYRRPGLKVLLKDYEELSEFVPLEFIRANASGMQQSKKDLEDRYGKPIYAPIEFSLRRPPRMLQGYMFKLPADYVRILGLETNVSIETGLYNPYNNFGNAPQDDPVERQNRAIRERRGQPQFRDNLLRAYGGKCSITGEGPEEVLEAVHIVPHAEFGPYELDNGLLMRADIHCLFDEKLLSINPATRSIELVSRLQNTS
ncbi:MAG: hypothetical protein CL743_05135, partial [Chloroflexi bacterium]|nr:hypothetical protein [Chloroflexota bacterium]